MAFRRLGNYRIFLFSNSMLSFALGLFTPFWMIFLQVFGGGVEQFGFAIGIMTLASAITSYYVGKHSDRFGRRPFLIIGGFVLAAVTAAYGMIDSLFQLYILQIINGVVGAMQYTMETSFLGDVTKKLSRGVDIGKYHAIVGIMAAISMMGGGLIVGGLGYKVIFYITAALIFVATLILFYIREPAKEFKI